MRIQLWSYNYAPEPTGIGPVSATWAKAMTALGHDVTVVAAHAHYPEPVWGKSLRPTRTTTDGVDVIRLPLWIGRGTAKERMRQDASFSAALMAALPSLPRADARVVVSPCFPALATAIAASKLDKTPWMLWVQDILPDGAVDTGLLNEKSLPARFSRKLELAAYKSAERVVVISDNFKSNLTKKKVPSSKLSRVYNPATVDIADLPRTDFSGAPKILVMGNIGHSQGLVNVVKEFESSDRLRDLDARLVITGTGVAAEELRASITTDRVEMLGLVSDERLKEELSTATFGLVSQLDTLPEFNFPSKLMNYLAHALPVIASVGPESEVASVINETEAGWVVDNSKPGALAATIAAALELPGELEVRSAAAHRFATANLTPAAFASAFEEQLEDMLGIAPKPTRVPVPVPVGEQVATHHARRQRRITDREQSNTRSRDAVGVVHRRAATHE
ncbi:MAG: glycosyltransferase family 4 protein [Thermoleophilaceae bacterium]|nr:glycosyltransferase family 4 protein [Thermoleophilaceae bacterium]